MIARSLGRTLEELGRTMSAQEFGLWVEAYRATPWAEIQLAADEAPAAPTDGAAALAYIKAAGY